MARSTNEAKFVLLGFGLILSGCFVRQLTPSSRVVTIEPDGSQTLAECVPATQIAVPTMRIQCKDNASQFVEECKALGDCTYTRDGKVFRQCTPVARGFSGYEADCMENGVHISRKCARGWNTVTCQEAKLP